MAPAIEVVDLSKRFRVSTDGAKSLKERALRLGRSEYNDFWALRDVEFSVAEGETVGLLGHNGSGKSTLLKCIGGILRPTSGSVHTRGRVASLLELGAGFHPELTGRENVYLNASILGITKRDVDARFDEIVGFAELEQFIDQQVKHYSSGMFVRLGFAVAVSVEPEILLIDEVLSVGDENFQRKCIDRIHQFQHEGRTIVFVSHAADQVRQICDQAVVLDHGQLVAVDEPPAAIRVFRDHLYAARREREAAELEALGLDDEQQPDDDAAEPEEQLSHGERQERKATGQVKIVGVDLEHANDAEREHLLPGEALTIRLRYDATEPTDDIVFGLAVYDAHDGTQVFGVNTDLLDVDLGVVDGPGSVEFHLGAVPLLDGTYPITIGMHNHDEGTVYDWSEQKYWFTVLNPDRTVGRIAIPVEVRTS